MQDKLLKIYEKIREITDFTPKAAVVLGSGNGGFAKKLRPELVLPYKRLDGFPQSTVSGHEGNFIFGKIGDVPVAVMNGRVHYYEGYPMSDVVLAVRLLRLMGAKILILTNAAGSLTEKIPQNSLMAITDHISSFVPSPLLGKNVEALGDRFPDMTRVYDRELINVMKTRAEKSGFPLYEGTYVQLSGPQYETPAEIRLLQTLGGHAVGMSTAVEAIAARHAGMRVAAISRISNMGAGMRDKILSHEDVKDTPENVLECLNDLIETLILSC